MNELTKKDTTNIVTLPTQADQVFSMLGTALEKGMSPEAIEKLVDLQERILSKNAEMAFTEAMNRFQAQCPPIAKNQKATVKTSQGGQYSYEYASLDHIAETIAPLLDTCGLSYTFNSKLTDGLVEAVCTVAHIGGHSKTANFTAPVDQGMKVGAAQKVASALTYARRYALISALGLTTTGDYDDDGNTASTPKQQPRVNKEQMQGIMFDILTMLQDKDELGIKQIVEELKEHEQLWVWQFFSTNQRKTIREILHPNEAD